MSGLLDYVAAIARGLVAIVAGLLPRHRWNLLCRLPISRLALPSALLTMAAGCVVGARGFMDYARRAASAANDATFELAVRQNRGEIPPDVSVTTALPVTFSALSLVAFLLFTPLGLFSLYLALSGLTRAVASFVDEPFGDPVLTGLDVGLTRWTAKARAAGRRRARERREGPEVPDRLLTGESAGRPDVDYVVIASRRKPEWEAGVFVITSETWYTLGEPFDLHLPQGLRTAYPLTAQTINEVLRRGVRYELPPLEGPRHRRRP